MKEKRDTCRFNAKWYQEYPFLEYSPCKDKAFCFVCRLFGGGVGCEQSEGVWTAEGTDKWDKMASSSGKLSKHFRSRSHAAAVNRYQNFITKSLNVDLMLDANRQKGEQQRESVLKYNTTIVAKLLDIARFLVRQNAAFRGRSGADTEGNR
jgi:hypothetical protein